MKCIGIVGSPRKNGNTESLVSHTLQSVAEEGIATDLIRLAGLDIRPCRACTVCRKEERCAIKDDFLPIYLKMKKADGIILASPVYVSSATSLTRALMERTSYVAHWNGSPFRRKAGGPLAVGRRGGMNFTIAELTLWFQALGFFIPSSTYWNIAVALEKGDLKRDKEGLETAWNFGKNMAFLMQKLNN